MELKYRTKVPQVQMFARHTFPCQGWYFHTLQSPYLTDKVQALIPQELTLVLPVSHFMDLHIFTFR